MKYILDLVGVYKLGLDGSGISPIGDYMLYYRARRAGSDGSMSASGSAGPGFDPCGVVNFH